MKQPKAKAKAKKADLSDPHNVPTASEEALVEAAKPASPPAQWGDR